jgi:hypothetical protein
VERRRLRHALGPDWVAVHPVVWGPRPGHSACGAAIRPSVGTQIEAVAASHASIVSRPEALTRLILGAVEETSRSRW